MTVREMIFQYRESGARNVAKKDKQVRQSIQRTGRAAQRNAGSVERWLSRNRKAIQGLAAASLAAVGAIMSASPTLRSQLGGVKSAFTLLSEEIISNVLPAGTNLGSIAIDLVNRFRDLPGPIKRVISIATVVGSVLLTVAGMVGTLITVLSPVMGALGSVASALGAVYSAVSTAVYILGVLLGVSSAVAAGLVALVAAVGVLAVALITDFRGIRSKAIAALTSLYQGGRERLLALLTAGRRLAARFRDAVVSKAMNAADRVLALLDIARDLTQTGKEWVGGLARGVYDRVSRLVDAFRSMASRAAQAFRDEFNRIIPSRISIPRVSIDIPNVLGGGSVGVGGGSLRIPQLDTGGRIASDGLAMLHAGERIMPAAQVRERGPQPTGGDTVTVDTVNIMVQGSGDARTDGRNIAREFERELSDRGA